MKNQEYILFGVVGMLIGAAILFRIYRHQYAGRPQFGWHLQIVAMLIVCAGVLLGLAFQNIQFGAASIVVSAAISFAGMLLQLALNRQFERDIRNKTH